ncbi:MAG: AraC family transcriptional regulator, partial [Acidobacteriaceae bacterium]
MPTPSKKRPATNPVVLALRKDLAARIAAHAPSLGENPTPIPGLALYRRTAPTSCFLATYEPSLTIFVQGRKRIDLNGVEYFCDSSSFLLSSIDVPAQSQILEASE